MKSSVSPQSDMSTSSRDTRRVRRRGLGGLAVGLRARPAAPPSRSTVLVAMALGCGFLAAACPPAGAQVVRSETAAAQPGAPAGGPANSLEAAASKAGETGRKVAMSLIGLAFAIAGIVLAFRRDFKEAAGVFAVGIVAILLATPAGIKLLHDTVNSLFGAS
jgi:hypothetical protein